MALRQPVRHISHAVAGKIRAVAMADKRRKLYKKVT